MALVLDPDLYCDVFLRTSLMATRQTALTADDVLDLPVPAGLIGYEFVDGHPVPVTPASLIHGQLIVDVASRLLAHVRTVDVSGAVLSDTGFVLGLARDPERMRAPDIAYVAGAKMDVDLDPVRFMRCAPDLAIEIDLTSGKNPGGQQRILDYLEAGTRMVWAIDVHSRTATVYRPDGTARLVRADEALEGEEVLPGFRMSMSELFG